MIYRVEEGKVDSGAIGYQTSSLSYTFSHWKGPLGYVRHRYKSTLEYKPIGPTILVEWGE